MENVVPRVSLVMPAFEQSHVVARALGSLLAHSVHHWARHAFAGAGLFRSVIEQASRSPALPRSAA